VLDTNNNRLYPLIIVKNINNKQKKAKQ